MQIEFAGREVGVGACASGEDLVAYAEGATEGVHVLSRRKDGNPAQIEPES